MKIEEAIKKAVEEGEYDLYTQWEIVCNDTWAHFLIDPKFWQALGKSMGWEMRRWKEYTPGGAEIRVVEGKEKWLKEWHKFIGHLAEGKTAEDFFAGLEGTKKIDI
jgi:hypothetical protein